MENSQRVKVDVFLNPGDAEQMLRDDVRLGLTANPKELPPKWFYDERGSDLFDQITRLDEYYPTNAERQILLDNAAEIVRLTRPTSVVELGSGTSDKTAAVLDAAQELRSLRRFVPFDVSEEFLRASVEQLSLRYPQTEIHGVVGDFDHHLNQIQATSPLLLMFLGGTIGNYRPSERSDLLADIAARCGPGDHVLIGVDLVKEVDRLELAYDDPQGVTAAFNKNVLSVINDRLAGDFNLELFEHVARFDQENKWIEMLLRSTVDQEIKLGELDLSVEFSAGELMRTEVSSKFEADGFAAELESVGFHPVRSFFDDDRDFTVVLARR